MRTVLFALLFTTVAGCASESAWVRDRHGWPVQTWNVAPAASASRTSVAHEPRTFHDAYWYYFAGNVLVSPDSTPYRAFAPRLM